MTELEEKLTQTVARLEQENELLRQKIDLLVKKVFGSSSEKLDLDQLQLFEQPKKPAGDDPALVDESLPEATTSKRKPAKRLRKEATLPDDLPVEETILIPDEVKVSPGHYR